MYGRAVEQNAFILDDALPEFRVGLYNKFTPEQYQAQNIKIKEVTWKKDQDHFFTAWYAQEARKDWILADTFTWHKEMEF